MNNYDLINLCTRLGLTLIPLKPRSKQPLVRWRNGWNPTREELKRFASKPGINWGIRCGPELVGLDFDDLGDYQNFIISHTVPIDAPIVRTTRGFHIWLKPKYPIATQKMGGVEIKGIGAYIVVPPSVSPTGHHYKFDRPPNGHIPEVDIQQFLGLKLSTDNCSVQSNKIPEPTTNDQIEFRELFARLGVPPGKNTTWCPWHPDREGQPGSRPQPSLSIDWNKCLFKCFSPRCGTHGGLERLRAQDAIKGYSLESEGDACPSHPITTTPIKGNSDTPIPKPPSRKPWSAGVRVETPKHRCNYTVHLCYKENPDLHRIGRVYCHQWNCAICGPKLKRKWQNHLYRKLMEAEEINYSIVTETDWPTVHRRLNRAKADYARIELPNKQFALFTTAKEGKTIPQASREEALRDTIATATFEHKAITTSRSWKLPEKKDTEWEVISTLPITLEAAKQVFEKLGLPRCDTGKDGFNFIIPPSWHDNEDLGVKRLHLWLQCGPAGEKSNLDEG